MSDDLPDRTAQLEQIRRTYEAYHSSGRDRLWDTQNAGFARIAADRDDALTHLVRASLPTAGMRAVLDVGCGSGDLAAIARAAQVGEWVGVDLLNTPLETARANYPWAQFIEASADALPFETGAFDVAVASTLFSSLPSLELEQAVAREIVRVLRPEGWLVWYDLRYDNPRNRRVHGLDRADIAGLFPGWRADLSTTTLLPPLARRLGPLTRLLYRPLELLPPLRSHLIGRLHRPSTLP